MKNLIQHTNRLFKSSLVEDIISLILVAGIILCLLVLPSLATV